MVQIQPQILYSNQVQRRILFDYLSQLSTSAIPTSVEQMSGDWLYHQYVYQKEIPKILTPRNE